MIPRAKRKVFTEEETIDIIQDMQDWWDSCGQDAFLDDHGRPDFTRTFSREEVYQMAADHIGWRGDSELQKLAKKFYSLDRSHPEKEAIVMKAFPGRVYGY